MMASYWTNFVKGGDPNGEGLPPWPPFDGDDAVLHLSDSVVVDGLPNRDNLQVFDAVYNGLRGKPPATQ
jgi:para-nitrobenzyl esterase